MLTNRATDSPSLRIPLGVEQSAEYTPRRDALCCCEYINREQERSHLLACCCNCEDFDLAFTRLIACRRIHPQNRLGMLLTFQDRLRIPWRGGAKQLSCDTLLPVVVLPLIIAIAAINPYTMLVMLVASLLFIGYAYRYAMRMHLRTRFFFSWTVWSLVCIVVVYEFKVPLLVVMPEENLMLVLLSSTSIYCLYRTKKRASMNFVLQSGVAEDELPDITEASAAEEEEEAAAAAAAATHSTALLLEHDLANTPDAARHQPSICSSCRKYVPARTSHCYVCGVCILRRDHHSYWLDCCIGEFNHQYYVAGLISGSLALMIGVILVLTAVCHPVLVMRLMDISFLMPDDCSEVFYVYDLGLSFVIAVYALIINAYIVVMLIRQLYVISRGITLHERQSGQRGNRKGCVANFRSFVH